MPAKKKRPRKNDSRRTHKRYRPACHITDPIEERDPENGIPIPNEILSSILSRCNEETLRNAMLTSRRWYSVINETIGLNVSIGKACATTMSQPSARFQPIEVIERLGVKECYCGDLTEVEGCPFRYPQTLRSMIFDGPITNFNFITLLSPVPTLTHLTLHFTTLENLKITSGVLQSASLKMLKLTSHEVNVNQYDWEKADSVLRNLINLLLNLRSQQLTTLVLDLVYLSAYDMKVTKAILTVLVRHKSTMRTVQCYNLAKLREPDPPGTHDEEECFPELSAKDSNMILTRAVKEAIHLKRISYAGLKDMDSDSIWNQLITSQKALEELFYMNDNRNIKMTGLPCLKSNEKSLSKVLFHINAVDEGTNINVFDCGIFRDFTNLTHLLIRGRKLLFRNVIHGEANIARLTLKIPLMKNIELIPSTITVLSLRDIYVPTESLTRFRLWMPTQIAKFRLVDTGSWGAYGILPDTLLEMMDWGQVNEIEIIRSFNRNVWEEIVGKNIFEDSLFFRVKSEWEFHGIRDVSGVMHYKNQPMFDYGMFETALRANDVCEVVFR